MPDRPKIQRHSWVLYSWLILIGVLSLIVILALPRIKQSFHESGMLPLIQEHVAAQESGKSAPMTSTQIAFALPQASFSYNFYSVPIKGAFPYHETIEALLQGPPYAALAEGAITFIPHGTRLIGLTVSHKVAYIDFSKEFLSPTPWESSFTLRTEQIRKTLRQEYQVRDVRILVEGELLIKEKLSTEGLN